MTPIPDAPESNAGDDFHLLWAARKALSLLNLDSTLQAIRPEGPPPQDAAVLDPSGEALLGIDVAEYHGNTGLAQSYRTADRVVYSQLKYSTRNPTTHWTASRLIRGKNGKPKGSVVHRLSSVYKTHLSQFGRDSCLNKLSLALVSNQPCDPELLAALDAAIAALVKLHDTCTLSALKHSVSTPQYRLLADLKKGATALTSAEFCDFLRLLDLSQCGSGSRLSYELGLAEEVARVGFQDIHAQFRDLKLLIHRWMMPETRSADVITASIVAFELGKPTLESLFPAPPRFEPLPHVIDRDIVRDVASSIATHSLVCVHGGAGMGKTTLIRSIHRYLPTGSVAVLFDSYGAGSYLDLAEVRHVHARAIPQISNTLARESGSPLLLADSISVHDLLRELNRRLAFASAVVRRSHPDALVVLIVDAADNSVSAALHHGDKSFIHDLVAPALPSGCRLIVTARTHRVAELRLPHGTKTCAIPQFSKDESDAFFRASFTGASDAQCLDFYELTGGIPRVARYAISKADKGLDAVLGLLRPDGQTVGSIIDSQLHEADVRAGGNGFVERACTALLALPRPIPVQHVAFLASHSTDAIVDLATDLCHGLRLDNGHISFRDEDFENHLLGRFAPDDATYQRLATEFAQRSAQDPYAASHLADILYRINDKDGLIELLHREREPQAIVDPVERKDVFARRARLALTVTTESDRLSELIRLLLLVGEANKSDRAVEDLLLQNADMACLYGNPSTVQRIYLSKENDRIGWYGPTHLLCAASFSRIGTALLQARSHLEAGEDWIRWWSSLPNERRENYHFDANALANGAEAALRLDGLRACIEWLAGWEPIEFVFDAIRPLVTQCLSHDGARILSCLDGIRIRADVFLVVIEEAMLACVPLNPLMVRRAVDVWTRFAKTHAKPPTLVARSGLALCEAGLLYGVEHSRISLLVSFFAPQLPDALNRFDDNAQSQLRDYLRATVLIAEINGTTLSPRDAELLPSSLRTEPSQSDYSAHKTWEEGARPFLDAYALFLSTYQLRARSLGRPTEVISAETFTSCFTAGTHDIYSTHRAYDKQQASVIKATLLTLVACSQADPIPPIRALFDALDEAGISLLLDASDVASRIATLRDEVLKSLDRARQKIESTPMPGSETVSLLTRCCRICSRIDRDVGTFYFNGAIAAASDIDTDVFSLLPLVAAAAQRSASGDSVEDQDELAADFCRFVEDCHWKLSGSGDFPWAKCVEAIALLSPRVAEAVVCRWDQRRIAKIRLTIVPLVRALLARSAISDRTALVWSALSLPAGEQFLDNTLTAISSIRRANPFNESVFDTALTFLDDIVTRLSVPYLRQDFADRAMKWARDESLEHHSSLSGARQVKSLLIDRRAAANTSRRPSRRRAEEPTSPTEEVTVLATECDPCVAESIENALRRLPVRPSYYQDTYPDPKHAKAFLEHVASTLPSNKYVDHLNAIVRVSSDLLNWPDLESIVKQRCSDWSHYPLVREWKNSLPDLIATYRFEIFFSDNDFSDDTLQSLNASLGLDTQELLGAILRVLPKHTRSISPTALNQLASLLATRCTATEASTLLNRLIPEFSLRCTVRELVSHDVAMADYPSAVPFRHLSGLLWYLFGHPDTRLRWGAAHVTRYLVRLEQKDVLLDLTQWMSLGHTHPFLVPGTIFYKYAAKQWFLASVDCIAREMPESALALADQLRRETIEPEAPHVLCIRIAKRAALRLVRHAPNTYPDVVIAAIKKTLKSRHRPRKSKASSKWLDAKYLKRHPVNDYKFDVDSMDTLPYWYEPLGRVFNVSSGFIARMAGRWVRSAWSFNGSARHSDPLHKWSDNQAEWQLMSNRQGSAPTIEDLQTYFETHAMHCVAGEMLAMYPLATRQMDVWEGWSSWLNRWDIAKGRRWLCDRRGVPPLDDRYWLPPQDRSWEEPDSAEALNEFVGLGSSTRRDMIVAWSNENIHSHGDYKYIGVDSALLPAALADAMAHACHGTSPHDYRIPEEHEDAEIDCVVGETRFFLKGWIKFSHDDAEGMEDNDPLRFRMDPSVLKPGKRVIELLGLTKVNGVPKTYRRQGSTRDCITVEEWSDRQPDDNGREFFSEGRRLRIRRKDLLDFLDMAGCAMIVKVQVTRSLHNIWRSDKTIRDFYDKRAKVFIHYADGRIETPRGDHLSWESDR